LQRMLNTLLLLGRAGLPPSFGDGDGGRLFDPRRNRVEHMLDPLAAGAILYKRGDFKFIAGSPREETLWLLGQKGLAEFDSLPSAEPSGASTVLPQSGVYLLAEPESGRQLMIDAGPLGSGSGGHGHADALSIALVQNGRNLLIDPMTFEYVGPTSERDRLRGTGAHNTLQVDVRDQAESTGPFAWRNQPRVNVQQWVTGHEFNLFRGSHDGYSRLQSPASHSRWVFHRKGLFWLIRDLAEGCGSHQLDIAWHLGPTLNPVASQHMVFGDHEGVLALLTPDDHGWSQSVRRDFWSPVYGSEQRASVVSFGTTAELPAEFVTMLVADENGQDDLGRLVRLKSFATRTPCAYTYTDSRREHSFFFATQQGPWSDGFWASDADFLYWSWDRDAHCYMLVLCNGSYADAGGNRVLNCSRRISYAEVVASAAKVEMFASEPEQVELQRPLDRVLSEGLPVPDDEPKRMGV